VRDLFGKITYDPRKLISLRGCNPFESQSFWGKADELDKLLHHSHPFGSNEISLSIMAFPNMTTRYQDTIRPFLEGF
jgi:hypothetical protein